MIDQNSPSVSAIAMINVRLKYFFNIRTDHHIRICKHRNTINFIAEL